MHASKLYSSVKLIYSVNQEFDSLKENRPFYKDASNLRRQICVVKFASKGRKFEQILMLPAGPWPVSLVVAMTYPLDRLGRFSGSNHREQAKSRPGVPENDTSLGNSVGNRPVPGPARAMRSRMTYPHTPQGTGKRIGTIGERRAQFYFRPNTWSKFFKCRDIVFEAP